MEQTLTSPSLLQLPRLLVTNPRQVVTALQEKALKPERAFQIVGMLIILVSLLFATFAVIHPPASAHWTQTELIIRFGVIFTALAVLGLPMLVTFWSILQRLTAWYWDAPLSFLNAFLLSGLGLSYYALGIALGLVVAVLPLGIWVSEILLFAFNIGAFLLTLRLFYTVYRVNGSVSRKRAIWITLFPLFVVALTYSATQLLTYFAMVPHLRGGGH